MNFQQGFQTTFRSLQYRNFRLFFAGQGISLVGTWMQKLAMPWLVYEITDSVFLLGFVSFAGQIPFLIISPLAGVIADRRNKYKLMIWIQILAMLQAILLTYMTFIGIININHLIWLSILLGIINAIDIPVRQSFMVNLLDNKEDLSNAIALNSSIVNIAKLVGPALAGFIIAKSGVLGCFMINAISYLLVIISLILMKIQYVPDKKDKQHPFQELRDGLDYISKHKKIKSILILLAFTSLMGISYIVILPVVAKEVLVGNSQTFGMLMGASGIGALIGAIYLASRKNSSGLEKALPYFNLLFGLGLLVFSFSTSFVLSFVILIFVGLGLMLQLASSNTLVQQMVDNSKRGRVMGFYTLAFLGVAPFGSIIMGYIADQTYAAMAIGIGGMSCIIGSVIYIIKKLNL